jgi:hypothetical protein
MEQDHFHLLIQAHITLLAVHIILVHLQDHLKETLQAHLVVSLYNLQGTPTHIPFFSASQILEDSAMIQIYDGSGVYSIAINENGVDATNPEALFVSQTSTSSFNVITGKGNLDNYLQLNIKNTNQGTNASSDVVATANNGNEFTNYIDMGINSENFSGFSWWP